MFDFGVAGPVFGMITSITFLVSGLTITAGLDFTQTSSLPVLPSDLLLTSALGGGLIESFLGRGALIQGESQGYLPLHPYAIAGFLGILTNALALLPLGSKFSIPVAVAVVRLRRSFAANSKYCTLLLFLRQTRTEAASPWPCLVGVVPTL